jgi:xylose isomerase
MVTPGAHRHFPYGGICSPDPEERKAANAYGARSVELAYTHLKKAWNKDVPPTFVLWNGSYGYDLASVGIQKMYNFLKEGVAGLCKFEKSLGGELFIAIEPKPNEGYPAMFLPTVASAIVFWKRLEQEYGIDITRNGVNKEFGHSEMIGLDHIYDTVEEIDNNMLMHMHVNSQGYNDGIILGGPGKFDIDHGARINGMNIAIAGLISQAGFNRWKGHDMQVRAHDTEEQGIDRVVRSVLSWESCERAASDLDYNLLWQYLVKRETAKAEDLMRDSVVRACKYFNEVYVK